MLQLIIPANDQRRISQPTSNRFWTFQRTDVDVFTLPFKIRPAQEPIPAQFNANVNAALYLGRPIDLYSYRWKPITPSYAIPQLQSRGFGCGLFVGIGSVSLNDFVTRIPIHVEYEGFVMNAGLASLYDARIFNIGLAVGVDQLMDANRIQWFYQ